MIRGTPRIAVTGPCLTKINPGTSRAARISEAMNHVGLQDA